MTTQLGKTYNLEEYRQQRQEINGIFSKTLFNVWLRWHINLKTGSRTLLSVHESLEGAIQAVSPELKIAETLRHASVAEEPYVLEFANQKIERRILQA
jgi:hypothetical protein